MNIKLEENKMSKIRVTFHLSTKQLAYGLQTIRQLEPNYQLTSINNLVKSIYLINNNTTDVPANIIEEINSFINKPAVKKVTLSSLMNLKQQEPNHEI